MKMEYLRASVVWCLMICPTIPILAARNPVGSGNGEKTVQVVQATSPATLGVSLNVPSRVAPGAEWDVSCVVTNQGPQSLSNIGLQIRRVPGLEVLSAQPGTLDANCCSNLVISGIAGDFAAGSNVTVTVRMRTARAGVWPIPVQVFHGTNDPSASDDEKFVYTEPVGGVALAPDFSLPFISAQWSSSTFRWIAWTGRTVVLLAPNTLEPKGSVRFPGAVSGFHMNADGHHAWAIMEGGEAARLNLDTGAVDLRFPVPLSIATQQGAIASSPSTPDVLVAFGPDDEGQPRLIAYDKGTPRAAEFTNELAAVEGPYRLVVSPDRKVFAALGAQLRELTLDDSGLSLSRNLDPVGRAGGQIGLSSGILYNGAGEIVNLNTLKVHPTGVLSGGFVDGVSYNLERLEGGPLRVRAYSVLLPGTYWSQDLAIVETPEVVSGGLFGVMLLGSQGGLVPVPLNPGVDLAVSASLTNAAAALDEVVTVSVTVSKSGAWAGVNTRLIAELPDGIVAVNPASTSNRWELPLGIVDQPITTNISFQIKQGGPQAVTLRVVSDFTDPVNGNNELSLVWNPPANQVELQDVTVADDGKPLTLHLMVPAAEDVDISFRLELLTASLSDVVATNVTARFLKGASTAAMAVVAADTHLEGVETFRLVLDASPFPGTRPSALITITNDDRVTVASPGISTLEGDSGVSVHPVTLVLSQAAEIPITLNYTLVAGTAAGGSDFEAAGGEVTFLPGQRTNVVDVRVLGDGVLEADETLTLALTAPADVDVPAAGSQITIRNDDRVAVSSADITVPEGDTGVAVRTVALVLSAPAEIPVTLGYTLVAGTATAGVDFEAASGQVIFAPGQQTNVVEFQIKGDTSLEPDETFSMTLTGSALVLPPVPGPKVTIHDDDRARVSLVDGTVLEGNTGTNLFRLPVVLETAAQLPVVVNYLLRAGTATAGSDFLAVASSLTFQPGQRTNFILVEILGDLAVEENETVSVELSGGDNVQFTSSQAVLTIQDDDTSTPSSTAVRLRTGVGGVLLLSFDTVAGGRYQVQSRPRLSAGDWANSGAVWTGTGEPLEFEVDSRGRESYFRVLVP